MAPDGRDAFGRGQLPLVSRRAGSDEKELAARTGQDVYDVLTAEAAQAPAGCEGLLFLPYLTGERTPHPDPLAAGPSSG